MNNIENWEMMIMTRGDHFRFGSVFINKSNQTEIFFFEKKTETEPKPGQTDRFRFGFFMAKTGSNRFGSVFSVLARFFRFGSVFFRFFSVSVRFGFFDQNQTGQFF